MTIANYTNMISLKSFILLLFNDLACDKKAATNGGGSAAIPADTSFTNPLLSTGPDPWIIQKDTFYLIKNSSGKVFLTY